MLPLTTAGEPRADESRPGWALGVGDNQDAIAIRLTEQDESIFIQGMARIWLVHGEWVTENRRSLSKRDAMFSSVGECLVSVPLKLITHPGILHSEETPAECA